MTISAQEIAQSLGDGEGGRGGARGGSTFTVLCPAHNDSSPSLSITERDGNILIKCHAGCSQDAVIFALRERGLWPKGELGGVGKEAWRTANWAPEAQRNPKGIQHPTLGHPSMQWEYRDRQGRLVGYIYRFNREDGGKEILPLSWGVTEDGSKGSWRLKAFNEKRPLYGGQHLLANPKAPVLIVEGEKTADAAKIIFPDYIVLTWPGGSGGVKVVDWSGLSQRKITIWPDADEPGLKAAANIAEILKASGAEGIKLVDLPEDLPKSWDLADEIPEELRLGLDLHILLANAKDFIPSGDKVIDKLNAEMGFVLIGGKACIIIERHVERIGCKMPEYVSLAAMKAKHENRLVQVGMRQVNEFQYWMSHPMRREYDEVVFEPLSERKKVYNLWRGFSYGVEPTGNCSLFLEHVYKNVAQGDEAKGDWIIGFFAQMIQSPRVKPGVSLAVRGNQGCGKSIIGETIGALIKPHWVLVSGSRYVTGNFNSHMGQALLLQSDEGFFAGDPRNTGILKSLITSETHRIEHKGVDSFEVPNYIRLFITSNSHQVVPAEFGERRFATYECGDGNRQDHDFFGEMKRQLKEENGYGALLHHLQTFDLKKVDLWKLPQTEALLQQKQYSMPPFPMFMFEQVLGGTLFGMDWGKGEILRGRLYDAYIAYCDKMKYNHRLSPTHVGIELNNLNPGILTKVTTVGRTEGGERLRERAYILGTLEEWRKIFDGLLSHPVEWEVNYEKELMSFTEEEKELF